MELLNKINNKTGNHHWQGLIKSETFVIQVHIEKRREEGKKEAQSIHYRSRRLQMFCSVKLAGNNKNKSSKSSSSNGPLHFLLVSFLFLWYFFLSSFHRTVTCLPYLQMHILQPLLSFTAPYRVTRSLCVVLHLPLIDGPAKRVSYFFLLPSSD